MDLSGRGTRDRSEERAAVGDGRRSGAMDGRIEEGA